MGLHMNIGDTYIPDPELREHRIRVWWSVYILDRLLSSKTGLPLSISDDDISVKSPSDVSTLNSKDFGDHSRFVALLRLARIAGDISRTLYVRTPQCCTFLQRVANIREVLELWRGDLPENIKFDSQYQNDAGLHPQPKTSTLQLAYNQVGFILNKMAQIGLLLWPLMLNSHSSWFSQRDQFSSTYFASTLTKLLRRLLIAGLPNKLLMLLMYVLDLLGSLVEYYCSRG